MEAQEEVVMVAIASLEMERLEVLEEMAVMVAVDFREEQAAPQTTEHKIMEVLVLLQ